MTTFESFTYDIDFFKENNIVTQDEKLTENAVDILTSIMYLQELDQIKFGYTWTIGADCIFDTSIMNKKYQKLVDEASSAKSLLIKEYYKKYPGASEFGKRWRKSNYDKNLMYAFSEYLGEPAIYC